MIEICVVLFGCGMIIASVLAGYYYGVSKSRNTVISDQNVFIREIRQESRDLMNKVLIKHGSSPIGIENKPREEKKEQVFPKVVTRQEMESREMPVHEVGYRRVSAETIEKAAEIINQ